ncbi:hypothetical protein [Clostridium chromiireducens]|nr:hypothetical protein [Clostridium chromiireducens]
MGKWKVDLESENPHKGYKSKQFIKIVKNVEPIKEFNVDLFLE